MRRTIKIRRERVPLDLRRVIPLARKWGLGDDPSRGDLVDAASPSDRKQLRAGLPVKVRRRISQWLDTFGDGAAMTPEAGHFMYLLEAYEERFA